MARVGVDLATRKARTDIATMLRDEIHEANIVKYIMMFLQGKNPVFVEDKNGPGGQIVVDAGGIPPTPERRDAYFKIMLERRDGLPAQRIHLEAEVRAAQQNRAVGEDTLAAVAALDVETLRSLKLLLAPKTTVQLSAQSEPAKGDYIEAEFTETKAVDVKVEGPVSPLVPV